MTQDNWIKAFDEKFTVPGALTYGYVWNQEATTPDRIKSFISQVEKDAIEKTNKRWLRKLGIKDGHSYKVWRDGDSVYFADEDNFKIKSDLLEDKK